MVVPAGDWCGASEYYPLLPEGVAIDVTTTGVARVVPEDLKKVVDMYLPAAKHLAGQECDVIAIAAAAVFSHVGYERGQEIVGKIQETCGVPVFLNLNAHFDALRAFSAKKIALISPFDDARNQERKRLCETMGFEVVNVKGLGFQKRLDAEKVPYYTTYRLARQACLESPDIDALYISCPEWPTVRNIEKIECDTGKPVVAAVPALIWAALKTMRIREPVEGYGKLMRLI